MTVKLAKLWILTTFIFKIISVQGTTDVHYNATILDNEAPGRLVFNISHVTKCSSPSVESGSIKSSVHYTYFILDENSTALVVSNPIDLEVLYVQEQTNVITVFVRCSEGTRVIIDIKVDPVNEFPTVFRQSSYDVTMEEFNGFGKFIITPAKGTVYPTQMFDSETLTPGLFYLNITITDTMNRTTWSKLTVNVTDVDDNGPVFTTEPSCKSASCRVLNYTGILSLDDGLVYNLRPAPILAVDGDKTLNAQVTYTIIEAHPEWYEKFVTINESGLIEFCTVCENFTTNASRIVLVIQATELTDNQFSANVTVILEVQTKENKSLACCDTSPLPTDVFPNCCGTSPLPTDLLVNCCVTSPSPTENVPNCCGTPPLPTEVSPNCCGTSPPPSENVPNCCGTPPLPTDVFVNCCGTPPLPTEVSPNCCGTPPPSNDTFLNSCNCTLTTTNGSNNELAAYVLKIVFPTCAAILVIVLVLVVVLVIRKRNAGDSSYNFKG
ncbi:hypothetical protein ACJMK2_004046 [Sinanodonta woodiana]|uniref:Cadherin domain-containing protein n=1 Tax=Sinanodonta woodiana TaxID=1069815 RepID=A0ABD3Y008_SINWO